MDGEDARRRDPSVAELRALSDHAAERVILYRRKVYLGRGDPRHLAELERVARGAVDRFHRARERAAG
jgi:hypothetical protein